MNKTSLKTVLCLSTFAILLMSAGKSHAQCNVNFTNTGCQTAELFWNNNGALTSYGLIAANSTKVQTTYNTHVWVVKVGATTVGSYTINCLTPTVSFNAGGCQPAITRPRDRTFDGTGNNPNNASWGATNIPFFRELPAEYADGKNATVTNRPNPRLLSNKLSNEPEDKHNDRYMAGMFYSFGQFFDHDITRGKGGNESTPIPLPSGEKIFTSPIPFTRSGIHPGSGVTTPRDQTNTTTAWVDASHVYSDNKKDADWLRTFSGGKLKVSAGNLLPFNTTTGEFGAPIDPNAPTMDDTRDRAGQLQKVFVAGDARASEHPVLTSLHTLFVREHNRLCNGMAGLGLSDEEIYQKARKEVGALMQNIVFGQWISSLGVNLAPYGGYKSGARPDIMNTFSTAAYRWHTMVENDIIFRDNSCRGVGPVELPLKDIFFNNTIVRTYGIDVLLKGISVHRSYETDLKVNSGLRNFLFGPGSGLDLVSLNIQRGRDHGLPNYNTVRQFYTGTSANNFTDIAGDSRTSVASTIPSSNQVGSLISSEMQSLYGSVSTVDLWVGLYAEPRLSGKSVGKTVDAILRAQLERLRDGDFYFFENDPALSSSDKARIRSTTLKDIIIRNTKAGDFQDNVFFVKTCSSDPSRFDDIAKPMCDPTPQYVGWTFIGKTGSKLYYKWNAGTATFLEAHKIARRLGGTLPHISNAAENNALKSYLGGSTAWLDLNKNGSSWQYSTQFDANDNPLPAVFTPYTNWALGRPNIFSTTDNNAYMSSTGQWNDIAENALHTVVSEVESDDFSAPTFTYCPPSINTSYGLSSLCTPVSWTAPTASDNCGSASIVQTAGPANGSCMTAGTSIVTYTATDSKGNKSTCSFNLNVTRSLSFFLQSGESLAMEAQAEPTRTRIEWVNNTGFKNDYFDVEKMNTTTGVFEKLETINNKSEDKSPTQYVTYDVTPTEGDNTYRIKVAHKDGTSTVSASKTVKFKGLTDVRIFPNPASDRVTLDLSNYQNQAVEIYLYNYLGQQRQVFKLGKVENSLQEVDLSNEQEGNYMVRIKSKGKRDVTKTVTIIH